MRGTIARAAPSAKARATSGSWRGSWLASANTSGWVTFSYAQFGAACIMTALGIWAMPVELMVKGYLMMSSVFLIGSTFTLAKTVRDEHEAKRFAARLEEARTEKLLMEVGRGN